MQWRPAEWCASPGDQAVPPACYELSVGVLLNSREWAIVTLIIACAVVALRAPGVRQQVPHLFRAVAAWKIVLPLLVLAGWISLVVFFADRVDLWNPGLLKDTIVWFVLSAFGTVFASLKAAETDQYFRTAAGQTVAAGVFLQYAMNSYTFNYVAELLLQGTLLVLGMLLAVARIRSEHRAVARAIEVLIISIALLVVVFTLRGLLGAWDSIDTRQAVLGLALSVWLPLAVLPYIWTLGLLVSYESVLMRLREPVFGLRAPARTRVALVLTLGLNLRLVSDLPRHPRDMRAIAASRRWHEVREAVRVYRRRRDRERSAEELASNRLARFAGVAGVDTAGRQRDQREIAETRRALEWLATCHMGHYRNRGVYRRDILQVIGDFTRQGLTENHGIQMTVAADGQSWVGWRRTPSGLVLGIGAQDEPPDQWFFASMEEPEGSPHEDSRWERWFSASPDWNPN